MTTTRRKPGMVQALDTMISHVELPYEAAGAVALAYETARRIDQSPALDSYTPLANSMTKQLAALREWVLPPPMVDEDPFDALARRLAVDAGVGDDGATST